MVDLSTIFIDGTHIKASVNKKKLQKEQVIKAAKVQEEQLRKEVSEERENWVRKSTMTMMTKIKEVPEEERLRKRCPKPTPDCGMFVKGAMSGSLRTKHIRPATNTGLYWAWK